MGLPGRPSGAYQLTCKKCHMDPKRPKWLVCHCQASPHIRSPALVPTAVLTLVLGGEGLDGDYTESALEDAEAPSPSP